MHYFKHSELAATYHVSLKTVHNWIDAAKQGKVELELVEHKNRFYVSNKPANIIRIQNLADQGKKYRNVRYHKTVRPTDKFYKTFSRRQIMDIISNLTIHREIPRKYNYFDGGANYWDVWLHRLAEESSPNMLTLSRTLIADSLSSLDSILQPHAKVNVIDLGVGNAMPVKGLLEHLLEIKKLNRYIALDVSEPMLKIAHKNIVEWFGDKVPYEGYVRDFEFERFDDLVVEDMLGDTDGQIVNLVLLIGMTHINFRNPDDALKAIYGSMGAQDILMFTSRPDTAAARKYFDFSISSSDSGLSPKYRPMLDMLNIDESMYEVENGFDDKRHMRYVRVRLNTTITIAFTFDNSERQVTLEKGETILLLRVWHRTALQTIEEFEQMGFTLLHSKTTRNREGFLSISGIENRSDS